MFEGRTVEQKKELAKAITEDMIKILNVKGTDVSIVYNELPKTNIANNGLLGTEWK
jgi:4-oxalocrotonate tautomerase